MTGNSPSGIATLNQSAFVAACNLRVLGGRITALAALESVNAKLCMAEATVCGSCAGEGRVEDPFEENGVMEKCPFCAGTGTYTPVFFEGDATILFAQMQDLAADLRDALMQIDGASR